MRRNPGRCAVPCGGELDAAPECALYYGCGKGSDKGSAEVIIGDSEPGGRIARRCGETLPDLASFDAHSVSHEAPREGAPADVADLTRAPGVR